MKKLIAVVLVCLLCTGVCLADAAGLNANQNLVFEAVRYNFNFPKNAQVVAVTEYMCKMTGDVQMRALLVMLTQHPDVEMMYGNSSRLLVIDLDTGAVLDYKNVVWPETGDIATREDALNMLFACYDSFTQGINPFVYTDSEMTFPMAEEEVAAINAALAEVFLPAA